MPLLKLLCFIGFSFLSFNALSHGDSHKSKPSIKLSALSSLKLGEFDQGAAEIVAYDANTQQAFVTNAASNSIQIISIEKPEKPQKSNTIDLKKYGTVNSVAVKKGLLAVAVQGTTKQDNGSIILFKLNGQHLNTLSVGASPDMLTFSPNGKYLLVANEGEPSDDYRIDPVGSVSIIELKVKPSKLTQEHVITADFTQYNDQPLDASIRIFGKNASVAQDLEPEYITVSNDSKTAWISLQENNAIAVIDIKKGVVTNLFGLGYKSYNSTQTAIDASDKDAKINIKKWPVLGMYQPDSIASYKANGQNYIVTANEGSTRDYSGYSEVARVGELDIEERLLKIYPQLTNNANLGRLQTTTANGDIDGNGRVDQIYSYGARSFSIWNTNGEQVYDSGSQFARIVARRYPRLFNQYDEHSDDKGAEPEALTLGKIADQTYAFIGLERTGGVMAYNITNPSKPYYCDYINTISPELPLDDPNQGDIAPESLVFVSPKQSPNDKALLISANEVSGTLSIYLVELRPERKHH